MSRKERQNKALKYFAVSLFPLFIAVALLIVMFMRANRERITEQNRRYLEDAASQTVLRIEDSFASASKSIALVSRLYELQLNEPVFDYKLLNNMSEPTQFDYIRFVGMDGVSWSGDGVTANCSDREYYLNGKEGRSGVCFVGNSRFIDEPIIVFYTPLFFRGEQIGVVNGILKTHNLSAQLICDFFGQPSSTCITLPGGEIVAASWYHGDGADISFDVAEASKLVSGEERQNLEQALNEGRSYSFHFNGKDGIGSAFMSPLAEGKMLLVQTFPPSASKALTDRANHDAIRLEIMLIALFSVYILVVAVYYIRSNRRLATEKQSLSEIVDSVKGLYKRFVIIDLKENSYQYLNVGNIASLGLPEKGLYSDWMKTFRSMNEENPDCYAAMDEMEPERLHGNFTAEEWYRHYDYRTPGSRWERLTLIKLDLDSIRTDRLLGAVEDITDTKLRDEENRRALETAFHAAEAASNAKSDFLSRMSHDIRTPMNAIVGLTAIMGTHLDDRDRLTDGLTKITTSSKHLLGLINEVLDMSKIESGKLVLSDAEFSLSALMDDLLSIIQPTIKAKSQDLSVRIEDLVHEDVIGDSLRLQQVFVNIMSNAVKYTGVGGHIKIVLKELPAKQPLLGEYVISVEDDGIGMSEEFLERVFTPFERAEDERVSGTQGTGLGMSIAQSIIHLMGGTIQAESELGKGSKFTVRLSLKLQDVDEEAEQALAGLPVLVADDEKVACEAACLMLAELGMQGEWVLTGEDAVARVKARHSDGDDFFAVILDWKMPGMDGVETAKEIRRVVGPDIPIIILSAYDWSDIENEARAAGVSAFIGKPLFKSRLRGVFVNLLNDDEPVTTDVLGEVKSQNFTGKRALLVEDNELNQEIACDILEMTGITVETAENGKIAVDRFADSPENYYDIVFMDIQMPVMNGYEATKAIRALPRGDADTVPIVAMTANTFSEDVQAALDSGMDQHIGKPLDMDQLAAVLRKWLSGGDTVG